MYPAQANPRVGYIHVENISRRAESPAIELIPLLFTLPVPSSRSPSKKEKRGRDMSYGREKRIAPSSITECTKDSPSGRKEDLFVN